MYSACLIGTPHTRTLATIIIVKLLKPIFLVIVLSGCSNKTSLLEDEIMKTTYTTEEIKSLDAILTFCEHKIGCNMQSEVTEDCWKRWMVSSIDSNSGDFHIPWSINSQDSLFQNFESQHLSDSLWFKSWSYHPSTADTSDYYYLNFYGFIGRLYSRAALENNDWKEVWESIEAAGEISPSLYAGMYRTSNPLISDPKMRLLMSLKFMQLLKNN